MAIKRVGIMTGGGDCPGLNAVIRAAVRTCSEVHGIEVFGIEDAFNGLVDLDYCRTQGNRLLSAGEVRGILARGGTVIGTSNRADPFRWVVHDEHGEKRETDVSDLVMENYRKLGLDALISIGGDGSMGIAARFADKGMNVVGVPKTIDNDLGSTDQTFGFDTAVNVATEAIDRLRDTAASHDRVMLVEVMGRDAGWIALYAGLAGGADAILLPEIPYDIDVVAAHLRERKARGANYGLMVVAEGAKPAGGETSALERQLGEMPRLMGAGARVAAGMQQRLAADMRVTVLGHIQRGGSPTTFDRVLGTRYGEAAANAVAAEHFGSMVSLRNGEIHEVSLADAVREPKRVDPEGQLVRTARNTGICFG